MTAIESDIDALWLAFEQSHDLALLGMLSDEYLSQGDDSKAECLRWCVEKRRFASNKHGLLDTKYCWLWKCSSISATELPEFLWNMLFNSNKKHHHNKDEGWYGSSTISRAYLFLCEGWQQLTEKQREELFTWEGQK